MRYISLLIKIILLSLYSFVLSILFITLFALGYGIVVETYKYFTVKEVKE